MKKEPTLENLIFYIFFLPVLLAIILFFIFGIVFLDLKFTFQTSLFFFVFVVIISSIIFFTIFKHKFVFTKWLEKNWQDIFLAFLLLLTLGLFNAFSKRFFDYYNRPSYEFIGIEKWLTPLGMIFGFIFLIAVIFFEIKLSKDKKLLKKIINFGKE